MLISSPSYSPLRLPFARLFTSAAAGKWGLASHLKKKQATKGPDFGSRETKSLKSLEVGGKKRASKSSSAKQGWLPWHSATVGAEGRARDVGLRDNGVLIHLWEPGSALD